MSRSLKLKDVILIALLTALYFVIYMVSMISVSILGPFGHAISPGIAALLGGSIYYFLAYKVGKFGQFTLMTLLLMGIFSMLAGLYIPWFITSMLGAVVADILASRQKNPPVYLLALASGSMAVGMALGAILPSLLFVESYKEVWIARGQSLESMEAMIHYTSGIWALGSTLIIFILSLIGMYLAHLILRKHLRNAA